MFLNICFFYSRIKITLLLHGFFYKKIFIRPQKLKKMLRKYPVSNALASNFKNLEFCKSYKIDKAFLFKRLFSVFIIKVVTSSVSVKLIKQIIKEKKDKN